MKRLLLILLLLIFHIIKIISQSNHLFLSDSTISIKLVYSSKNILVKRNPESPYLNTRLILLNNSGDTSVFNVGIKSRGIFRLKAYNCYFPPLSVLFDKNEIKNTIFKGNSKIKLVLPCRKGEHYEQFLLLEYLAYKIYNLISDYSFKVRLIKLKLDDSDKREPIYEMYAFFIEPIKSIEKRTYSKELEVKNIHPDDTDYQLINRLSIFQYMIGNTDWSVKALHNIVLLSRDSLRKPVAIPYDFDFSGLVDAPYASPADHLRISSVRQRFYNGYIREMNELLFTIAVFKERRNEIYQLVKSVEGLKKSIIDETLEYFDQFYSILDDHDKIKREFIEKCRKD